jgi:ElaB/YqjD/DUF883 family membrane-anchored ribosome-binding protein
MDTAAAGTVADALHEVIEHAEALLGTLEAEPDARLSALRERVADTVESARARLAEFENAPHRPIERIASAAEQWVAENPWATVAICAGVGLALGVLLARGLRRGAPREHDEQ